MSETVKLTDQQYDDLETMEGAFGLCVGQLTDDENRAFERLCKEGFARRVYSGPLGLMGLAKAERDFPPDYAKKLMDMII